jgi:NRAMP (natural resistance-associated macrophage protein)-like metal ion transporter
LKPSCQSRLGAGGVPQCGALSGWEQHHPHRRHYRGDRHAACGLSALRPHPESDRPAEQAEAKRIFHFTIPEILIALGLAGLINMAMLYMAAATFYKHGMTNVADIPTAYHTLTPLLGPTASTVFAISLASGLSSSAVGTMAGQIIMQGFVGFSIPLWFRRVITMIPTVVIVYIGLNPTQSLFWSQVVLSMVLPIPVIALIYFTRRRDLMGISSTGLAPPGSQVSSPPPFYRSIFCCCTSPRTA